MFAHLCLSFLFLLLFPFALLTSLGLSFLFLLLFPFALLARISNPLVNGVGAGRCEGFSFSFLIAEGKLSLLHYEE